jgi:hypothetical protein
VLTCTAVAVAALATWQAVEIWHHSSLLATVRARVELWDNVLSRGLSCPFCLSNWVAGLLALALTIAESRGLSWLALPALALAVARLANLGNDLTRTWNRTPKFNRLPFTAASEDTPHDELGQ